MSSSAVELAVRVARETRRASADRRSRAAHGASQAGEPGHLATQPRRPVEALELLVERAGRLGLQPRNDALEPRVLGRRQIDRVAAGRERRVLQLLEVLPHVVDDRVDQVSGGPHALDYDARRGRKSSGIPYDFPKGMRLQFADFTVDTGTRQLHRAGGELHLSPKAFDLLALLLAHRPAVVDKETLRDSLWPGTNVVDANLNNLVSEIRSALDDDPQQPRFVRTVHRVGFAFCGTAEDAANDARSRPVAGGDTPRLWLLWNDRTIVLVEPDTVIGRDTEELDLDRCSGCVPAPRQHPSRYFGRSAHGRDRGYSAAQTEHSSTVAVFAEPSGSRMARRFASAKRR